VKTILTAILAFSSLPVLACTSAVYYLPIRTKHKVIQHFTLKMHMAA